MLDTMLCPVCKSFPLKLESAFFEKEKITEGKISCTDCHRVYPIVKGIPNMLPDELRLKKTVKDNNWNSWKRKIEQFNRAMAEWTEENTNQTIPALENLFYDFCSIRNSVLDIGSACGIARHFLGNVNYWGVDPEDWINYPKINVALEEIFPCVKTPFPFFLAVGEYLPFKEESFDNVLIISALDHVNSPHDVFKEAHRVLKKGGKIILATYCFEEKYKEKPKISQYLGKGSKDVLKGDFATLGRRIIRRLRYIPDFLFTYEEIQGLFEGLFRDLKYRKYKENEWFFKAIKT